MSPKKCQENKITYKVKQKGRKFQKIRPNFSKNCRKTLKLIKLGSEEIDISCTMAKINENEEIASVEKLSDSESFEMWNFQITVLFKASDLYTIVCDEEKLADCTQEREKKSWIQRDAKAQKILISTVEKTVLVHIMNCGTSAEMYKKLKDIFKKENEEQKCHLLQQFFSFQYERGTDISLHVSKLQNLVYRLKSLKQDIDDDMLMSKILSTLPERFSFFKTAWESTGKTEKTLTNLVSRLLAEENSSKTREREKAVAFQCSKSEKVCYSCQKPGHLARFCKTKMRYLKNNENKTENKKDRQESEQKACTICKKTNHIETNCFFRDKQNNANKTTNKKVSFLTELKDSNSIEKNIFVMDSGSTSHMMNDIELFDSLTEKNVDICVAKKNALISAKGVGSIETEKCILNEVLYVPELSKNLLSVSAITENKGQVIFDEDKVCVMKDNIKVLEGEKNEKGLYIINLNEKEECLEESMLTETKEDKIISWHRKLGHINIRSMKKMVTKEMVTGIDIDRRDCDLFEMPCEVCLKAKQVRFPFESERTRAKRPLELIHTDLCGPIDPTTWDGKIYMLTILDDYTHYAVIYLLKHKYEVTEYVKEYIAEMEVMHNVKVSKMRSDNGKEYLNDNLIRFCKEKGIIMDTTIPYTPQLNGKAERLNRTLEEKIRSLLFDSKMEKKIWGEAARVATYIINRSSTESLPSEKTPVEMWTGQKPNLKRMQIFGSEAYSKTLGYLKKLEERSEKHTFVGYAPNGYRLWDNKRHKIIIRRDVMFKKPKNDIKLTKIGIKLESEIENGTENQIEIEYHAENKSQENNMTQDLEPQENQIEQLETNNYKQEQREEEQYENDIEYIYEESDTEENSTLGQGKTDRRGRKITKPSRYDDYVMLTYTEAMESLENQNWKKAIDEEKSSLEKNATWKLVNKEETYGSKILTSKWVLRKKSNGKYKARLVIRGCEQKYGIDYTETFSPVVNANALRVLFAIAASKDFVIRKFDIKTAFLYGELKEKVFMYIPEGYEQKENQVCQLQKSLYGLKQAPLQWNRRFTNYLKECGLNTLKTEQCIFKNKTGTLYLAIYVDDGILIYDRKNESDIENLMKNLKNEFEMVENEEPDEYLGIQIARNSENLILNQKQYTEAFLEKFNMKDSKPIKTPMLNDNTEDTTKINMDFPYREALGSLLYLTNRSRPDLTYAVNMCTRKMENPTDRDVINVKRILKYLSTNPDYGLKYNKDENVKQLIAYCDSDFAGDTKDRKSTSGYVIFYCGAPVIWNSRKQPIVALSTTEAEYISAADCTKELMYLKYLIEELIEEDVKITLKIDNQSALKMIKNGQMNRRSKHIDVRYHFINEKVSENSINLEYVSTDCNISDIFTKPLEFNKFKRFRAYLLSKLS